MIMEKLSIREASQTFGISRARLYQLLDKGIVAGHRSKKKGRGGGSWVNAIKPVPTQGGFKDK
jgi:hypothetical protein